MLGAENERLAAETGSNGGGGWVDAHRHVERCCESFLLKAGCGVLVLGREQCGQELGRAFPLWRCRYLGPPGVLGAHILQQGKNPPGAFYLVSWRGQRVIF